jgi:RNA polymerase sigma-70 factor (ECF subfamily)
MSNSINKYQPANQSSMKIYKNDEASSLWMDYKLGLHFYILKKVKDQDLANELSHEVLTKLYNSCCSGNEIKNVRSWIFQIAHNTTIDYLKKQSKISYEVPENSNDEENSFYQEARELINPLLKLIPEKYATPLLMANIQGLKQDEVSKKLGLSLTATKSRIQRARKLLKDLFIECCHMETDNDGTLISLQAKKSCEGLKDYQKED